MQRIFIQGNWMQRNWIHENSIRGITALFISLALHFSVGFCLWFNNSSRVSQHTRTTAVAPDTDLILELTNSFQQALPVEKLRNQSSALSVRQAFRAQPNTVSEQLTVFRSQFRPWVSQTEKVAKTTTATALSTIPAVSTAVKVSYEQQLVAWLNQHKRYPRQAKLRNLQGKASVRIAIDRRGNVKRFFIEQPSGYFVLDQALTQMVKRADPFPEMPASYPGSGLEFIAPVRFHLATN